MPYHWVIIGSSPPSVRRQEIRAICYRHGGRLCEGQLYYGQSDEQAHALVELPADPEKRAALLEELEGERLGPPLELVDADEWEDGKRPPPSDHQQS